MRTRRSREFTIPKLYICIYIFKWHTQFKEVTQSNVIYFRQLYLRILNLAAIYVYTIAL